MDNSKQNRAALAIRGALAIQRKTQVQFTKEVGFDRALFNLFLCRKIDLLPEDIQRLLDELKISDALNGETTKNL